MIGKSIHFCATCDGAFYKGKKVLVIGGGNSGFEEGLFLTKFASQVDIVGRSGDLKACQVLQEKVRGKANMNVITNHTFKAFVGKSKLEKVLVQDQSTDESQEWKYDGVFVFIGMSPNNDLAKNITKLDKGGFIITDQALMSTFPGLFAAGDVRSGSTKQAASAVGEGATAALMIRDFLRKNG